MPIFAGLISGTLAWFVTWFGARISTKLALLAGVLAVGAAGWIAAKAALLALIAALSFIAPPSVVAGIAYALPTNVATCIGAIFISDAIHEAYDFWTGQLRTTALMLSGA